MADMTDEIARGLEEALRENTSALRDSNPGSSDPASETDETDLMRSILEEVREIRDRMEESVEALQSIADSVEQGGVV